MEKIILHQDFAEIGSENRTHYAMESVIEKSIEKLENLTNASIWNYSLPEILKNTPLAPVRKHYEKLIDAEPIQFEKDFIRRKYADLATKFDEVIEGINTVIREKNLTIDYYQIKDKKVLFVWEDEVAKKHTHYLETPEEKFVMESLDEISKKWNELCDYMQRKNLHSHSPYAFIKFNPYSHQMGYFKSYLKMGCREKINI